MKKVGIFFGSSSGNTEDVANKIQKLLGDADVHNVDTADKADIEKYDNVIFGSSTWGAGDLQDDFDSFIGTIKQANLAGKKVALFGLGDSISYADTFANSMSHIYAVIKGKADVVGAVSVDGYAFEASDSVVDGQFIGLAIDEDNESSLTDARVSAWVEQLKTQLN